MARSSTDRMTLLSDPVPEALLELRAAFVGRMWHGLRWVAIVAAPASVSRAWHTGWLPAYTLHLALALLVISSHFWLRAVPARVQAWLLLATVWSVGLPGTFIFGLAAPSILWLVLSVLIASSAISTRAGRWTGIAVTLALIAAAGGFVSGWLVFPADANTYVANPFAWVNLIAGTGIFVLLTLYLVAAHHAAIEQLLQTVARQNRQIEMFSTSDQLTGLRLRHLVETRIRAVIAEAGPEPTRFGVVVVDLDNFRHLNHTFGYEAGDRVLAETARRITAILGEADMATRIGGTQFLLFLGAIRETYLVVHIAERLIASLSQPVSWNTGMIVPTVHLGISIYPEHSRDLDSLRTLALEAARVAQSSHTGYVFAAPEPATR